MAASPQGTHSPDRDLTDPATFEKPLRPSWEIAAEAGRAAASPRLAAPIPAPTQGAPRAAPTPPPPLHYAPPPVAPNPPVPASDAPPVSYDLAGNPIPSSGPPPAASYAPPTPGGYAAVPGAAVWPPPVGGPTAFPGDAGNTSGQQGHLPPEIERLRWNWGAFFFPGMWLTKHGLKDVARLIRYGFLALVVLRIVIGQSYPIVFFLLGGVYGLAYTGVRIYFATKGHGLGWRNRHFPGGVNQYFVVQNRWMWWGIGLSVFWIIFPLIAFVGGLAVGLTGHHAPSQPSPYAPGSGSSLR